MGYGQDSVPEVLAHPDRSSPELRRDLRGVLEYSAQYAGGEPVCRPPSHLLQTIAFGDGFFRVVASEAVVPATAPLSQI